MIFISNSDAVTKLYAIIAAGLLAAGCSESGEPPSAPPGMLLIPGGEFTMGSDDSLARPREKPPHRVKVDGFFMDATPVTNAQFRAFVEATEYLTTSEKPADLAEIMKQLNVRSELVCEHKADFNYPIVAAASILAKVTRDRIVAKLHEEFGDFASGYLSDPKTQEYMKTYWDKHPSIFRQTWAPYKLLQTQKQQSSLGDF